MEQIKNILFKIGCWAIGTIAVIVICAALIIGIAALGALAPLICLVAPFIPTKDLLLKDDDKDKDSQLITE